MLVFGEFSLSPPRRPRVSQLPPPHWRCHDKVVIECIVKEVMGTSVQYPMLSLSHTPTTRSGHWW
jgi:hypothetical protein